MNLLKGEKVEMKFLNMISNLILSFLLVIIIIVVIVFHLASTTILNKEYVLKKLKETEYYLQISREIQNAFENYRYQSGLPEEMIKDLYTEEMIQSDVNSIVDYIYEDKDIVISEQQVKEKLDTKIKNYLVSEGKILNKQGEKNVQEFEDLMMKEYYKNFNVSESGLKIAKDTLNKIIPIYVHLKYAPLFFLVMVFISIILLNIKDVLMGIRFVSISLLTTGILLKIGKSFVFSHIDIDNRIVLTASLSNSITTIIKEILYTIADYGTWFVLCGIIGIIITSILKNTKAREKKS